MRDDMASDSLPTVDATRTKPNTAGRHGLIWLNCLTRAPMLLVARPDRSLRAARHPSETAAGGSLLNSQPRRGQRNSGGQSGRPVVSFHRHTSFPIARTFPHRFRGAGKRSRSSGSSGRSFV